MTRGRALSDEKVIDRLNKDFVAVELNITDKGFPKDVAGLKLWESAFAKDKRYQYGFATSVVLGPLGNIPYGTSGCGHTWEYDTSINYDAAKYFTFLEESTGRLTKARAILEDASLSADEKKAKFEALKEEILKQLHEANRCRKPREK